MNATVHFNATLLGLVALTTLHQANAQTAPSCLSSPATVGCIEPTVNAGTTATITPTFPNPIPTCAKVANNCKFNFSVPVATQQEWSSFLGSAFVGMTDSCATVSDCESAVNGACSNPFNIVHGSYNTIYQDLARFGCSSPTTATNEYQAPKASGMKIPHELYYLQASTWTCAGTGGGSTASCRCLEIGTAQFISTGPFPVNQTFTFCSPY